MAGGSGTRTPTPVPGARAQEDAGAVRGPAAVGVLAADAVPRAGEGVALSYGHGQPRRPPLAGVRAMSSTPHFTAKKTEARESARPRRLCPQGLCPGSGGLGSLVTTAASRGRSSRTIVNPGTQRSLRSPQQPPEGACEPGPVPVYTAASPGQSSSVTRPGPPLLSHTGVPAVSATPGRCSPGPRLVAQGVSPRASPTPLLDCGGGLLHAPRVLLAPGHGHPDHAAGEGSEQAARGRVQLQAKQPLPALASVSSSAPAGRQARE